MKSPQARRQFLRAAAGLAALPGMPGLGLPLAGLAALAAQSSHAADVSGPYKAVVCLFMHGGCDTHNWVVPTDPTGYAQYAAARGELAWPLARLQPITTTGQAAGRSFGMPEELSPLRKWYEAGQAAVVARGLVLAVEAQEGTDAVLARVAGLPRHLRGTPAAGVGVLAKAPKPIQETRVDLPTIGLATVEAVARAGLAGIIGPAGGVLVLDRAAAIARADELGLFILGVKPEAT
jgi:uncharacterized protein (DUF1501 family)